MTDLDSRTVEAITRLGGLDLDHARLTALAAAAAPTQQLLREMADSVDLGETPPSNPFHAGWE